MSILAPLLRLEDMWDDCLCSTESITVFFVVALRVVLEYFSRPLLEEALDGSGVVTIGVSRLAGLV